MNCGRCDFKADDLSEHAAETKHYLCIVCQRRSLRSNEPQTCAPCIARVRVDLADILHDVVLLEPSSLTALTLLGDGTMQRLFNREEAASYAVRPHPLARPGEQEPKPIRDELLSDPLPVLPALASWEDYWREDFGDPKGPPATLAGVIGYLMSNLDTGHEAAQRHHGFDDFAADVRRLHSAVRHAAGLADDPVSAPAQCFDCGEKLLRTYDEKTGLTDDWTCSGCRGVYDQQSYFLALRAHHAAMPAEWRPLAVAAWLVDRPFRTVQTWVRELSVGSACLTTTGRQVVWMPDVKAMADATQRRERKAS